MLIKRHQEMQALARNLQAELHTFKGQKAEQQMYRFAFSELDSRMGGLPLRAFFVKKSYELLRSKSAKSTFFSQKKNLAEFTVKLPFVFEVIITIQYLHNQILDGKAGVTTPEAINQNLLAGNLLKDFLYDYIDNNFSKRTSRIVEKVVRKAFHYVDMGQYVEKNLNTLAQFNKCHELSPSFISEEIEAFIDFKGMELFLESTYKYLPLEYHSFTETYFKRIYLTCAALFKLAAGLLCDLLQVDEQTKEDFLSFSATYGMMRQIINDNADVVPASHQLNTRHRPATDAFSDWNNKNITLPLILLLSDKKTEGVNFSCPIEQNRQRAFFELLLQSNALFISIHQARLLAALAKNILPFSGADALLLLDTCEIANWNKFLAPCLKTQEYKLFKRTAAYRYSKKLIRDVELASEQHSGEQSKEQVDWKFDVQTLFPAFRPHLG